MFRERFSQMMYGRNGIDFLGKITWILSAVLFVATIFSHNWIVYLAATGFLLLSYFRMMSKKTDKRYLENQKILQIFDHMKDFFKGLKNIGWKTRAFFAEIGRKIKYGSNTRQEKAKQRANDKEQKKIYRFYKCKQCKQKIRVPRGRGKIEITCPKCQNHFIKKT